VLDKAVSRTAQSKFSDILQERNAVLYYCMLCIACKYNCQCFKFLFVLFLLEYSRKHVQQAAILIKENF